MNRGIFVRIGAASFLLASIGSLAACGGGDGGGSGPSGRATGEAGVPDGAAFIDQNNLKFSPSSLKVASGEVVYFKNSETTLHSVTVNGKNESGTMKADVVFPWTPPGAGTYKITCDFHPQMKSTVTVE